MNTLLAFDIETVAKPATQEELEQWRKFWEPPGNVSKPETIAKKKEEAEEEWLASRALRPGECQIVSWAMALVHGRQTPQVDCVCHGDERELLDRLCDYLAGFAGDKVRLCGYNVRLFDIPVLAAALERHNMSLPVKFGKWDVVDLFETLGKKKGLKYWSTALAGIDGNDEISGSGVAKAWNEGRLGDIREHNVEDVVRTCAVARSLMRIYDL